MFLKSVTLTAAFATVAWVQAASLPGQNSDWRGQPVGGASGSAAIQADQSVIMEKTTPQGILFFYNGGHETPLKTGATYRALLRYEAEQDLNLMLQPIGAKRSPYPGVAGKQGKAEMLFTAKPGETAVRIHVVMHKQGKAVIRELSFEEVKEEANLLKSPLRKWAIRKNEGSQGSFTVEPGKAVVKKTNSTGYIAFVQEGDFDIIPGHNYLIEITAKRTDSNVTYGMMINMPGGKRTPYPTVSSKAKPGEAETLRYIFTARPDEKQLRPHLIVKGTGEVEITGVTVRELSAEEMKTLSESAKVTQLRFDAPALRKHWNPSGSEMTGDARHPFVEFSAALTGGIRCGELNWSPEQVRSVEVDCRVAEEGGYYLLSFTSEKDGRKYQGECGWSALPDGKWHIISFPVGQSPAWRGKITSLKLSWMGKRTTIGVRSITGLPVRNALYDLRPRARCRLSRSSGTAPLAVHFLDRDYREIGKAELPASAKSVEFTVPLRMMTCRVTPENAPVLIEQLELPHLDRPDAYWRGSWIWCQNGFGPDASYVWFRREFDLADPPRHAEFAGAGDDAFLLFVNGKEIGGASDWSKAVKFDVASALKAGRNEMLVRVYNAQAWGGLLCELYTDVNGKVRYIASDNSWQFAYGTKEKPGNFEHNALILGAPPVAPWNSRVGYTYVGPKGRVKLLSADGRTMRLEVLEAPAVKTSQLNFDLRSADGKIRSISAKVTPATSEWKKGETIDVRCVFPDQFKPAELFLNDPVLEVEGDNRAGSVPLRSARAPELSTVKIENSGIRPWININGKRYAPIYYLLSGAFGIMPEKRGWMIRNARMAGCEILRFGTSFDQFWPEPGRFDFSMIDRYLETIFHYAPDAHIIVNVKTGMPEWWLALNPDDATKYFGNHPRHMQKDRQALASKKYLKDAPEGIRALLRHLKNSPYADRVAGIAISEGWNSEWFWSYADNNNRFAIAGYSPADYATFRSYLRERYKTDSALQKAWAMPGVTIDNAPMPDDREINRASAGSLLDPAKDMQIIDWFRFRNRSLAEAIEALCKVVKEESNGKWLAGAYYGYYLAMSNIFNRLQSVGHLNIRQISESPYVDFLTAPSFYTWRHAGEGDAVMQIPETFTSRGKLIVVEQDLRTFPETSSYDIRNGMLSTPEQSVGALERCFALALTRGVGTHWLEMYENWFREELLIDVMRDGKAAYEKLPPVKGYTPAQLALVADPESAIYTKHNNMDNLHTASVGELRRRFNETGTAYCFVTLDDLLEPGRVPPQKLYIIADAVMLTPERGAALMKRFEAEKATVLWLYAAGVSTPEAGPSAEAMGKLLGMTFVQKNAADQPTLLLKEGYGVKKAVNYNRSSPWFYPESGFDEVIGKTPAGQPAFVRKTHNGATHYFSTLMNLPMPLLRVLAEKAGAHIYGVSDDPVFAGNDVVAIHAKTSKPKQLRLPEGFQLRPVLGPVHKNIGSMESFALPAGRTAVFALEVR